MDKDNYLNLWIGQPLPSTEGEPDPIIEPVKVAAESLSRILNYGEGGTGSPVRPVAFGRPGSRN